MHILRGQFLRYKEPMDFNLNTIIQNVVTLMPAFLLALVVHEFAHAWVARKFGDRTSEWSGRLTLNPTAHMDPFGTILFPLLSIVLTGSKVFFGWAKPVPIDPRQFTSYRSGLFWVSFAGPLSNIILGFLTAFAVVAFTVFVPKDFAFYSGAEALLSALLVINFSLAIFNLIPLPPLDGSNMVLSFLDYEASRKFLAIQQYSFFILIFLMFSGILSVIRYPIMFLTNLSLSTAAGLFRFALPG
jgi:Zn-dependent protease